MIDYFIQKCSFEKQWFTYWMCSLCIQHLMSILHAMKDTIWKDTTTYKYIKCPKIYTLWQVNAIVKCHLNLFSMISTFTFWQIITANKVFNTIFHCIFYSSSLLSLFESTMTKRFTTWWHGVFSILFLPTISKNTIKRFNRFF